MIRKIENHKCITEKTLKVNTSRIKNRVITFQIAEHIYSILNVAIPLKEVNLIAVFYPQKTILSIKQTLLNTDRWLSFDQVL